MEQVMAPRKDKYDKPPYFATVPMTAKALLGEKNVTQFCHSSSSFSIKHWLSTQ
jgi:hypothetical protein